MEMEDGKMYQVIDGEPTEVIRWGDRLLPVDHPLASQIVGQLVLFEEIDGVIHFITE